MQYGSNSLVDQNYSIYAVDYGKVATESLKGGVVGALEAAGGQVVTNLLPPLNFCGKGAMEAFGDMAEHWAVNTLANGATGMAATFFSNLIDGQSVGEALDSTLDDADSIWTTAQMTCWLQMPISHCYIFHLVRKRLVSRSGCISSGVSKAIVNTIWKRK